MSEFELESDFYLFVGVVLHFPHCATKLDLNCKNGLGNEKSGNCFIIQNDTRNWDWEGAVSNDDDDDDGEQFVFPIWLVGEFSARWRDEVELMKLLNNEACGIYETSIVLFQSVSFVNLIQHYFCDNVPIHQNSMYFCECEFNFLSCG